MKKFFVLALTSAFIFGCAAMLTNCGGSGSSGGGKVKENKYLGKLPAIYANYEADKKAYENEIQAEILKLASGDKKSAEKIMKLKDEKGEKLQEMEDKFNADVNAEIKVLVGREIPVSYSENLQNSDEMFYTVATPVKLVLRDNNELYMVFRFSAKDTYTMTSAMKSNHPYACFRYIASDKSTVHRGDAIEFTSKNPVTFAAGELIKETDQFIHITQSPGPWENFAGIEFCTSDEHKTADDEWQEWVSRNK